MEDIGEEIRKIPNLLESPKQSLRRQGYKLVDSILSSPGLPDGFAKGIGQLIISILPTYSDRASQYLLLKCLENVTKKFGSNFKCIINFYASQAKKNSKVIVSTPALSKYHAFPLEVGAQIWTNFSKMNVELEDTEAAILVDSIAVYFSLCISADDTRLSKHLYRKMKNLWKDQNVFPAFLKSFTAQGLSLHHLIVGGWLLRHVSEEKIDVPASIKLNIIQCYVITVFQSKIKASVFILEKTSMLVKQIEHEELSKYVLPAAQKSLLRYPEIVLEAVGYLFMSVNLDLSRYIKDFLKILESPLHAKEDQIREDAVFVCEQLAKHCSEAGAVQLFVKMLFDVFFGSDGKLTVNSHKITLLKTIEKVSDHSVVNGTSSQAVTEEVVTKLLKVLESETHEASLIQALSVLQSWGSRMNGEIPAKLIEFFPKGMNLKSSTTNIRGGYCRALFPFIHLKTAPKFVSTIPSLMQIMDKALSQPSHVPSLTEALAVCTILLKILSFDSSLETKMSSIWSSTLDFKKNNYFASEKFLMQTPLEGIQQLIDWSELLLSNFAHKFNSDITSIYFTMVWCLLCSYSKARLIAQAATRRLCSSSGGGEVALQLVTVMVDVMATLKPQEETEELTDNTGGISAVGAMQGLIVICNTNGIDRLIKEKIAIAALKVTYHPCVVVENAYLWDSVCRILDVKAFNVFEKHKSDLIQLITDDFEPNSLSCELVRGLSLHGASMLYPELVSYVITNLDDPEFLDVSDEDIAIYNTSEGTIYNQKVVEEAFENELNLKNVKKTNKVYSHQEQLLMLEERRKELEKKRKEGKLDLTPKQKEVMKNQLDKEANVRNRVRKLEEKSSKPIALLNSAIAGNLQALAPFLKHLTLVLIKYFSSKLIGEKLAWIFYKLKFHLATAGSGESPNEDIFAAAVSRVIIRANDVAMEIPLDWLGEEREKAAIRCLKLLHDKTVSRSDGEDRYLTAAGFGYCYPLLEWTILSCPAGNASVKERINFWGLNVIKAHVRMRGRSPESPFHPKYLPREQLLQLLIAVISTRGGRVQQTACAVLQDVCACASGLPGCDRATQEEISILLNTLTSPAQSVRDASLRGLNVLIDSLSNLSLHPKSWHMMTHRLWVARHDEDPDIQNLSTELWNKAKMSVNKDLLNKVLTDITHSTDAVRCSAAMALAALAKQESYSIDSITQKLIETYKKKLQMTPPKKDQYDHIIEEAIDHWEGRSGVALSIFHVAPLLEQRNINSLAKFFVPDALGDRHETVRKNMLDAAMAVVNHHGKENVNNLIPVFEKFLSNAPNNAKFDAVRQSVVILMGSLAKHLDQNSPKIKPIVSKLIEALSTPSQQVQESVANCLHPLVPAVKEDCPKLVTKLMNILLESNNYGQRKGAAYGLASLVKGLGILSLKQLDIMNKLTNSIQDKKMYRYREGSLFAIEQLCNMLGKLFEPYIVYILPHLLVCFGDGNSYVRQAADDTAKAVMSKLSAHGVKLVLPSLLAALEEDSWRTKTGSVELLGNMAFCAPKQLSSCLPSIVPRLIDVLSDSHQKVQIAGAEALKLIGSVIRNPEIQAIVPVMLDALQDPSKNTSICLQTLLETKFVHFIDAPSLALIMPAVQRAFQDRSTEVRKMAAQIIGNMYSLTDQKDLAPYLPSIIPGLKASLLDPVPKVRSVSARALGAMVKGMGESSFDDLLPWLMQTLTSEASPVDRSGAAQGLAEVVGGLGPEKLHKLMPDIVATAERSDIAPHVKDGYIMMFIFLPTVFEDEFTPYIGQIITPILKALADENEYVRETALRAGQRIVNTYAESAITLLLPELENGLFHDNWRIRFSSVQLLGDLLYRVSGVSGKMTTDTAHEDDNFGTEQSQRAIITVLGEERRNRVLAGLYMGRSDVALMVRQAALHVWKVVVTNTPKTLREILPTLFSLLLGCLASTSYDKRQVAARTLGDLVRKLGERVLPEIIPILEAGLESPEADHRQGVCIGLSEIMESTSRDMVLCFANNLVPTVRRALCDPLPAVREAAAHTFDSLHTTVGSRALDDILPHLLKQLRKGSTTEEFALDGLKQVMTIKSRVVLPYLIPQLTSSPINTEALCILSSVAGETLTRHLHRILPALLSALTENADRPAYSSVLGHCQEVILAVSDDGVNIIVDTLLQHSKSKSEKSSRAAVALLLVFCSNTKVDYTDYASQLIRGLIHLFTSSDDVTLQTAWNALAAVTKSLDPSDQRALVNDVRQAVKFAASDMKTQTLIPGFCLPKGIQPILPIFREAVLNGEPEHKEAAANGLTEVIRLTSSDALKTSVVHVTGPLIRILGDKFAWNVKVAVLDTLALLLEKAGPMLKPFLPQLQTTFVKAVHDPFRVVRLKAGYALSHLISIHTKPDPLFTELHNSVKASDDPAIRETMLQAVRSVVGPAGFRMSETVSKSLLSTLTSLIFHEVESIRLCSAGALGVLLQWLSKSEVHTVVQQFMIDENPGNDYAVRHGKSSALFSALKSAPVRLFEVTTEEKICRSLLGNMASDHVSLVVNGVVGVGFLMNIRVINDEKMPHELTVAFSKAVNHSSNEVKQAMCRSCQYVAERLSTKKGEDALIPSDVAKTLLPMLVNGTKEKNPVVRSSAEMALIAILKMDKGAPQNKLQDVLEGGARDALQDVMSKILKKGIYVPVTDIEMDPSLLT